MENLNTQDYKVKKPIQLKDCQTNLNLDIDNE